MIKMSHEEKQGIIFMCSLVVSVVFVLLSLTVIGLEAYVRWTINQDFTFLGGNGLAALVVSSSALLIGLSLAHRK